eukprot:Opistho-1_new@107784
MAEYDLTPVIGGFLDRHLVFPLLEFLQQNNLYTEKEILQGKLDLLSETNLVDFAMDIYRTLHGSEDVPQSLVEKRQTVVARLQQLTNDIQPIIRIFENQDVLKELRQDKLWNLQYLEQNFGFEVGMLDTLYDYAKFQYDCGNYAGAADHLYHYCVLSTDAEKCFSAMWGKFAAEILMHNWDGALEDMTRLKEIIDNKTFATHLQQLQQRTWLIHWSLFVFFNHPKGRDAVIDTFFQPAYLNAIQTTCPHILRYLATAVITNKRRRTIMKDLVKVITQESYKYKDPVTELLECLYVNFDFDGAQHKLRECEKVLSNDFFLVSCRDEFIENARLFIFETYCRIHQCISIGLLAEKLNMSTEDAERWIVNLIRNARLDAKIDSKDGNVVMGTQIQSVYYQVIEKTKGLSFRSHVLANNIEKRANSGATIRPIQPDDI